MKLRHDIERSQSGAALLIALGMLAVLMVFGFYWINYMVLENDNTDSETGRIQAQEAADAGIQAAIGSAEAAFKANTLPALIKTPADYSFPAYKATGPVAQTELVADSDKSVQVHVTVTDESAKVNINHAPPNVLKPVLNIDGERARQIRSNLPRLDGSAGDAGRRWLTSVDELVTRGLITAKEFEALDRSLMTVQTVADPATPTAYIDLNEAPKPVIEAVLDVTPEVADAVIAGRPYTTVDALSKAAGKTPDLFNIRSDPQTPQALPRELSFTPRSLRIVSECEVTQKFGEEQKPRKIGTARAEAIIVLDDNGGSRVTYWSEARAQ